MDIRREVEALLESETPQSLRYWLDSDAAVDPGERATMARLALDALMVLATYDVRESRPVVWTLARLIEAVQGRIERAADLDLGPSTSKLVEFASRHVVLELAERRLIFLLASDPADLTASNLSKTSFIVKTWSRGQVQDYFDFLSSVCANTPYEPGKE